MLYSALGGSLKLRQGSVMKLSGKIALITGGGRGIGKAIARVFAREGADLIICSRTEAEIENTASEIRSLGRRCLPVKADVSSKEDVQALIDKAVKEFGKIDILVNNAGGPGTPKPLLETEFEDWNQVITINLTGTFLCSKAVAPLMIEKREGSIINVSSGMGKKGRPRYGPYCASKFGVEGLTQVLALELKEFGIAVNALAPNAMVAIERLKERALDQRRQGGAVLEPEEVAEAALFLATQRVDDITGISLNAFEWIKDRKGR